MITSAVRGVVKHRARTIYRTVGFILQEPSKRSVKLETFRAAPGLKRWEMITSNESVAIDPYKPS